MTVQPVPVFVRVSGVNNVVDPSRLVWDPKDGIAELSAAVNVVVDRSGRVKRRKGFEKINSYPAYSVFAYGNVCLFVSGSSLYRLRADLTVEGIRSGLTLAAPLAIVTGK